MWMKHTDQPGSDPAEVAESAFNDFWRHRGWQASDPPPEPEPSGRSGGATSSPPETADEPPDGPAGDGGLTRTQPTRPRRTSKENA